jgi:integrase
MAKRSARAGPAAGNDNANRIQLGPYWLWYRAQRDEWCICWYDDGGATGERRTRRISTGVRGGGGDQAPQAAQDALARHFLTAQQPTQQPIEVTYVESLMKDWLRLHARVNLADPVRYANGVDHWIQFFLEERKAGRLTGPPTVGDINSALVERFHAWRRGQGVGGHTIARDTAALRQPLNWAWKKNLIPSAPFIPDVREKAGPRDLVYSVEQIAAFLEAAWSLEERQHIHLFAMIMLSTNGRVEAVLELESAQIQDGLIYFNAPGRKQTKKRRSIVPICPTLAPWLEDASGRVIQWQKRRIDRETGQPTFERIPADSIKGAFEATLLAAGITEHAVDENGDAIWLPPRRKLGETAMRPKLIGLGSPNTLRHTASTEMHRRGVPEAQIETAAGHQGEGTNKRHYRHLRPGYLKDFVEGVESLWAEVGKMTQVHLRYQRDTKIIDLGAARIGR